MNCQEIAIRVMRAFGDESAVQITPEDIMRWINDGMKEIAISNHLLETKASADVLVGTAEYTLPADLLELWSVRWNNYKIKSMSMQEFDEYITNSEDSQNYQQGAPGIFWTWANKISLYPLPDTDMPGGLVLYYSRMPTPVVNPIDIPEISEKYHLRLVDFCLKCAYELDEDYSASSMKEQQLLGQLTAQYESEKWSTKDFYPMITTRPEDY